MRKHSSEASAYAELRIDNLGHGHRRSYLRSFPLLHNPRSMPRAAPAPYRRPRFVSAHVTTGLDRHLRVRRNVQTTLGSTSSLQMETPIQVWIRVSTSRGAYRPHVDRGIVLTWRPRSRSGSTSPRPQERTNSIWIDVSACKISLFRCLYLVRAALCASKAVWPPKMRPRVLVDPETILTSHLPKYRAPDSHRQ